MAKRRSETLGQRIRRLRAGRTRRELAAAVTRATEHNLHADTLRTWEEHGRQPAAYWIPGLADALGVTCDELLRGVSR